MKEDLTDLLKCKNELFLQFKKVVSDINQSQIHNYFCTLRNCEEISLDDLKLAKKDSKFQHKRLFDPNIAKCEKTNEWCLVYLDGKGMFYSLCGNYDVKQNNGQKVWYSVTNIRCRTHTVNDHF